MFFYQVSVWYFIDMCKKHDKSNVIFSTTISDVIVYQFKVLPPRLQELQVVVNRYEKNTINYNV